MEFNMKIGLLICGGAFCERLLPGPETMSEIGDFAEIIPEADYPDFSDRYECVVNLCGSCFPKKAWNSLRAHLCKGKGLVNLGSGMPFSVPVRGGEENYPQEHPQTAFHEALRLCSGMDIPADAYSTIRSNPDLPLMRGFEECFSPKDTIGLLVRFTDRDDLPGEIGSSGPADASIVPLLMGYSEDGRQTAAPVVLIENSRGEYAGGRWVFVNQKPDTRFWEKGGARLLKQLAEFAAHGAYECSVRSNYASYFLDEQPMLSLQAQEIGFSGKADVCVEVEITREGTTEYSHKWTSASSKNKTTETLPTGIHTRPGLYHMVSRVRRDGEPERIIRGGFWGFDEKLLGSGDELTCGKDYFCIGGKPAPIVGTTYMSDMHRKCFLLPNVSLWDADMAEMERIGINVVRTGLWTAYRKFAWMDGAVSEDFLRSVDAFFLTARLHGLVVTFTFFAFTPEAWEGENPYFDPRSIEAQKRFVGAIVQRHAKTKGITWDLINEPSLCVVPTRWRPTPNGDRFEQAAWHSWLRKRHGTVDALRERWNCTPEELTDFDDAPLPQKEDFVDPLHFIGLRKPMRSFDYVLFTQWALSRWITEMTQAIRAFDSCHTITVGQDEAMDSKRPSPQYFADTVDYTTCHTWWLNDDIFWDGIYAKVSGKPCLIQETGIMYSQTPRGGPRRGGAELRNILERKFALAFAADGAGAVHWVWNVNQNMRSLNEVNIGAVLADGSQKPEAEVCLNFGTFMRESRAIFGDLKEPETGVVFPSANSYSVVCQAVPAAKKATRILAYRLGLPFRCYGDNQLEALGKEKLILLPSPRSLTQQAWETLLEKVRSGCTLYLSGPFSEDEYFLRNPERCRQLGLHTTVKTAAREELLRVEDVDIPVSFSGNKVGWVDKEICTDDYKASVRTLHFGKGRVVWSMLPVELSDTDSASEAIYHQAAKLAKVKPAFQWVGGHVGIFGKKLSFENGALFVFVSEGSDDQKAEIEDASNCIHYRLCVEAGRCALFAVDRDGEIVSSYRGKQVKRDSKSET